MPDSGLSPIAAGRHASHNQDMERNRIVGIGIGAAVVLALATIVISALVREPASLDPDTPEGVVGSYVTALIDERWADARSHLDEELRDRCDPSELARARVDDVSRVSIDDVTTTNGSAIVDVTITHSSLNDPLNPSSWDQELSYTLVREDGRWVVDEIGWPYPPCRLDTP